MNLHTIDEFLNEHPEIDIVLIESGGDNLAATFNPELADYFVYVISVAEATTYRARKVRASWTPTFSSSTRPTLPPHVDADLGAMRDDCERVRDGPTVFSDAREDEGIDEVAEAVTRNLLFA